MDQMIGVVRLERLVVDNRMCLEGVVEPSNRPVHQETMERPLEEGCKNGSCQKADCDSEKHRGSFIQ
jgi:hypothetical protein